MAIKNHYSQNNQTNHRLSNNIINATLQTPDKTIWIATENGLNKIDLKTEIISNFLVNPNEKEVLSDSTFYGLAHSQGQLWINGNSGLQVIDQKTLKKDDIIFPEKFKQLFSEPAFDMYFLDKDNLGNYQ